ncbi:MAG: hypothetical protein WC073_02060 [Sterolibacterium sp.]
MNLATKMVLGMTAATLLAACGSTDSASYQIAGPRHSLSLIRTKELAWSKGWELALVAERDTECMRRHHLQPTPEGEFKAQLFRSLEGNYILQQGNNWYVTETRKCQLQQFKQAPREPGDLLGTFNEKEGRLQFVAAPKSAATPPPPTATPMEPLPATVPAPVPAPVAR